MMSKLSVKVLDPEITSQGVLTSIRQSERREKESIADDDDEPTMLLLLLHWKVKPFAPEVLQ